MISAAALAACPACGQALAGTDLVCAGCGSRVAAAERRVVTVLFVDLVGYTTLCAELDHEEVHLLVRPLMNGLRRLCEDLGGAVPAIEGDGFMAVFGALQAAPEDPARALMAAARMQALVRDRRVAYGQKLTGLRTGVHVGEVLTAPSWEKHGFSVSGDVINVASRLCDAAQPGQVLGSAALKEFVPGDVWGPDLELKVRGRAIEVRACALSWEQLSSATLAGHRPIVASLTGRHDDLQRLRDGLRTGPVGVFGEAGVGKSRFVEEWLAEGRGVNLVGSCSFFDSGGELGVVGDLVRGLPESVLESLEGDLAHLVRAMRHGNAEASEHEQAAAAADVLRGLAASQRVRLVVEDLQWATTSTRLLVDLMVSAPGGVDLVITARGALPEDLEVTRLELLALDVESTVELVKQLLPNPPADVLRVLVERSGGLPLFVEQCAQMLLEDGTVEITPEGSRLVTPAGLARVPAVMRLFVGARLDLLGNTSRHVLMTAAVLGDRVDIRLLQNLLPDAGAAVEDLVERGLMRWDPGTEGTKPTLRFSHALVRDVAYERQLRRARIDIHCAAADWYGILPAREMLEARARHLRAAVEVSPPDCALAHDTVVALTTWASSIVAERPREARSVLEEALALAESQPECPIPLLLTHLALASVYELVGLEDRAAHHAAVAAPLASAQGDASARAEAALLDGRSRVLSEPDLAEIRLSEAETLYIEAGDRCGAARAGVERAILVEAREGLGPLIRAHELAFRAGVQFGDQRLVAQSLQQLAFLTPTRSGVESRAWIDKAASSQRADDLVGGAMLALARSWLALECLDLHLGVREGEIARAAARTSGVDYVLRNATTVTLEAGILLGRLTGSTQLHAELTELAAARPNTLWQINSLMFGALLSLRQGEAAAAKALMDQASLIAEQQGAAYERGLSSVQAQIALDSGRFDDAAHWAGATLELDAQLGQPLYALRPRLSRLIADVAAGRRVSLAEGLSFPRDAQDLGAPVIATMARLWLALEDTLLGSQERLLLEEDLPELPEALGLVHDITALRQRTPSLHLEAAAAWGELGTTVWQARSLIWHSELTGQPHPEADDILVRLHAPQGLADVFRSQVRA